MTNDEVIQALHDAATVANGLAAERRQVMETLVAERQAMIQMMHSQTEALQAFISATHTMIAKISGNLPDDLDPADFWKQ